MTRETKLLIDMWDILHRECHKVVTEENYDAIKKSIKALEQESVLDKIRAEIEKAVWEDVIASLDGTDEIRIPCLDPNDVFEIIDKYKTESEE